METISSRKNAEARVIRQLLRDKDSRRELGMFAAEGDHLCGEVARMARADDISLLLYTEKAAEKYAKTLSALREKCRNHRVITEELAEYIADTKTPQGLFCAASLRLLPRDMPRSARRVVVLDGLQDPGNIGTILRTAEALGFDAAVSTAAVDVCSPKVLRASMGSALRVPWVCCGAEELRQRLRDFTLYAAMLDDSAERLGSVVFPEKTAVVIGNEGAGVSEQIARMCDKRVYIPINGAESLNAAAAAAMIMWEASGRGGS